MHFHVFPPTWKGHGCPSHSTQDNICLLSSSTSCVKDAYLQTPQVPTVLVIVSVVLHCQGHLAFSSFWCRSGAGVGLGGRGFTNCMHQDHLLGGPRVLCRIWGRVEDRGTREGTFISITGHFHFGNRGQPWLLLSLEHSGMLWTDVRSSYTHSSSSDKWRWGALLRGISFGGSWILVAPSLPFFQWVAASGLAVLLVLPCN